MVSLRVKGLKQRRESILRDCKQLGLRVEMHPPYVIIEGRPYLGFKKAQAYLSGRKYREKKKQLKKVGNARNE